MQVEKGLFYCNKIADLFRIGLTSNPILKMDIDSQIIRSMLEHIAEFFHYMSDNKEQRLYYLVPLSNRMPYAYQHSSIRDVATICDILGLVQLFDEHAIPLANQSRILFENVTGKTLRAYNDLYQVDDLSILSKGNIGDIGFFLFAMQECDRVFPAQLPNQWKETKNRLVKRLLERQTADGSMRIFFDTRLAYHEKSAEAFYLPEALIGLIEAMENNGAAKRVQKAIDYCCQDSNREYNLASDSSVFYANWQFQLLYHWARKMPKDLIPLETGHLEKLIISLKNSRFAKEPFGGNAATVEVACYLEGLAHAQQILKMLKKPSITYCNWFEQEISRSLKFLYEVQMSHIKTIHGGFVHSLYSNEARIDVAGHVLGGLCLLFQ